MVGCTIIQGGDHAHPIRGREGSRREVDDYGKVKGVRSQGFVGGKSKSLASMQREHRFSNLHSPRAEQRCSGLQTSCVFSPFSHPAPLARCTSLRTYPHHGCWSELEEEKGKNVKTKKSTAVLYDVVAGYLKPELYLLWKRALL